MKRSVNILKAAVILLVAVFLIAGTTSCRKGVEFKVTRTTGTIQKQGITTYQYGSHILVEPGGQTLYALRSENLNLDDYLGKEVDVKGHLVEGYPVDGGPEYLDVTKVTIR